MPRIKRLFIRITALLLVFYILTLAVVVFAQKRMIYNPRQLSPVEAEAFAKTVSLEAWRAKDGTLLGWQRPNPSAANRLVVFHGKGNCALDRKKFVNTFQKMNHGNEWEVLLFEYPGFGARPGEPGLDTFIAAGKSALLELAASDSRPIFVFGESLGSCLACYMAGELPDQIAGVGLYRPLARLREVAANHYPWLPTSTLLEDDFDNIGALSKYRGPVAFVVAGKDEVVTPEQGLQLHDTYPGPKHMHLLPNERHNGTRVAHDEEWCIKLSQFLLAQKSAHKKQ